MEGELNRASLFFRYIREENEHHKSLFEKGKSEMLESLKNVRVDPSATAAPPPQQQSSGGAPPPPPPPDVSEPEKKEADLDLDIKKIYRKIVMETHPDKTDKMSLSQKEKEKRERAYKRATAAAGSADGDTLIELAVDFEIETGLDEDRIASSLRRRSKILEDEINKIRSSVEWVWIHTTEERKVEIIKEICKRNGWLYVTDEQITESIRRVLGTHPGSKEDLMRRARASMQKRRQIS